MIEGSYYKEIISNLIVELKKGEREWYYLDKRRKGDCLFLPSLCEELVKEQYFFFQFPRR